MTTQGLFIPTTPDPSRPARQAIFWAIAGATGTVAGLPYTLALNPALSARIPVSLPLFALAQFGQTLVLLMLLSWLGLRLGQAIGLGSPLAHAFLHRRPLHTFPWRSLALAALAGSIAGAVLILLDKGFQPFMPAMSTLAPSGIALWKRMLTPLYGGITEELMCRLFLMTLLIRIARSFASHKDAAMAPWIAWTGILGAAILFGLGHLPATASVWPLTPVVIGRGLLLNAIAGTVFGWLYWRRGLEHAMAAHIFADIVVHVIGGS